MKKIVLTHRFLLAFRCYCASSLPQSATNHQQKHKALKHFELIKDFIGGPPEIVKRELRKNKKLQLMDEKVVMSKIELFKELELTDRRSPKIIPYLSQHHGRLINRCQILHEYGIHPHEISTSLVKRYPILSNMPVSELKGTNLIDKNTNVLQNLWKAAELPLERCPETNDELSLYTLKAVTLKAYMEDKLGISDAVFSKIEEEVLRRLQNKSFKIMNVNYYIFKDIIGLSKRRMATNWYILRSDPGNVMDMLNRIKKVGNMEVKDCLFFYPKICLMTSQNMEKIIQYVQSSGIQLCCIEKCIKILTLNCETVNKRILELKSYEYFLYSIKNPNILFAVYYLKNAKKRIKVMDKLKLPFSITDSCIAKKNFERLCLRGIKSCHGDCLNYLQAELNMKKEELLPTLKRHPRWMYVPLIHVGRNLQDLRKSFSDEDIKKNIYVLLYPNEKLVSEMRNLDSQEGLELFKENGYVKKEYILPLVIYFLEKQSNFTGDSVWEQETDQDHDLPDPMEVLKSCS